MDFHLKLELHGFDCTLIDNEWKSQKRIPNFCFIGNHKGETIGKQIEACLNEWGLKRVFSVTVDNANSNDRAIAYLKKKIKELERAGYG